MLCDGISDFGMVRRRYRSLLTPATAGAAVLAKPSRAVWQRHKLRLGGRCRLGT